MADATNRRILIGSFSTPKGAERALDSLKSASVGLGNTAIVTRNSDGKVDFTESADWGIGKSALVGAIAGFLLPGVGTITLAAGGALAAYFIDLGFSDTLLKQMGEGLTADSSMLIALVEDSSTSRATDTIAQSEGIVLGSTQETDLAAAMATLQRRN